MTKICSIFLLYFCTYIFCLYKNTKNLSIKRMTMKIPCMLLHVTVLPVHYSKNDFIIILTRWGCILVSIYFLLQPLSDVSSWKINTHINTKILLSSSIQFHKNADNPSLSYLYIIWWFHKSLQEKYRNLQDENHRKPELSILIIGLKW